MIMIMIITVFVMFGANNNVQKNKKNDGGKNSSLNINTTQHKQTKYNINLFYFAYLEQMLVFVTFD